MDIVVKNGPRNLPNFFLNFENVPSKFSLYVQTSLLGKNQHVSIVVAKSFLLHRCVGKIHMDGKSFSESGISVTSNRL